jgi:hypothetical protein
MSTLDRVHRPAAKQIIVALVLNTLIGGPLETSGDLNKGAIQRLVDRAIESEEARPDLDPFRSAAGSRRRLKRHFRIGLTAERNGRLVDILLLGYCPIE